MTILPATAFKILTAAQWAAFQAEGRFEGSPADCADGFIHLSAADQVEGTLERHFAGQTGLVIAEGTGELLRAVTSTRPASTSPYPPSDPAAAKSAPPAAGGHGRLKVTRSAAAVTPRPGRCHSHAVASGRTLPNETTAVNHQETLRSCAPGS